MQREVIKWLQSLDLTNPVQNPKRDLATGHAAAEIVCRCSGTKYIELQRLPNGASSATKRDIWLQVYTALQKLHCQSVTPQLIDAVLRREPNAALTVLECLYEHFTSHTLPMHGLDAVGTTRNAYVQPSNAASTAKLLAVANGTGNGRTRSSPADLYDPLSAGTTSPKVAAASPASATTAAAATAHGEQIKKTRFLADVNAAAATGSNGGDDVAGTSPTSHDLATRTLQQRLALIDNDELAGGANALQAYPRYARATASTLVHAATATRKDVVLDRPKYTADETRQRAQNTRIAQQHAVVQRLQEETSAGGAAGTYAQREDGLSSFLSWPAPGVGAGRVAMSPGELPLTTVYRGRFYREPDAATSNSGAGAAATSGGEKGRAGGLPAIGAGRSPTAPWLTDGGTDDPTRLQSQEKGSRTGSGGNTRTVPKLRVQVHSTSLQTALALRSGEGQLRDRAAALSRELFAKHEFLLRPALSEILCDVLGAHRQLEHLLDCSSDDGSGEALENVLGHLLAHRHAFPLSCMRACWDALSQHVEGIAAALQQTPDEYSYLMECFAFAFTREAAQVPVLQMPSRASTPTTVMDGYVSSGGGGGGAMDSAAEGVADVETSAGTAAPLGDANGSSSSATGGSTGELHSIASSRQSSLDKNANAATRRASDMDSDARDGVVPRRLSDMQHSNHQQRHRQQQQLPMIVNARQLMDLTALFQLLRSIAQLLDVPTAVYVLRRYTLRAARPFLLRHGSTAVQEAVADVVSATFTPAATSTAGEELPASDVEAAFTDFLTTDLPKCVLACSAASVTDALLSDAPPAAAAAAAAAVVTKLSTAPHPHISPLVQRQRVFWHIFQRAVSGFTTSSSSTDVVAAASGGNRFAYCLQAAARMCLGSGDVVICAVGVALVRQCCERWCPLPQQHSQPADEALDGAEGNSARVQTGGVLRRLVEGVLGPLDSTGEAASQGVATAWWNLRSSDTWELRMMVLHLCVTLLTGACGEEDDDDVCRTADAAAAACLSSFAAPATGGGSSGGAFSPFAACAWQLHLALITASAAVCSTRAPTLTAQWGKLLSREVAPTSLSGGALLPCEGLDVHQLLAPLQALSGGRGFLVPLQPGVSTLTASAATAAASQRAESLLSTSRPFKPHVEGKAGARGSVGGVKLQQQQQQQQRTTATLVLGDTAASLPSVMDHSDAVQLVGGRVVAVYPLVPLYQVCSTYAVLDAVLPAEGDVNTAAATPLLQLQVLTATLAAAAAAATASATADPALREREEGFWRAVSQRAWPLFQSEAPFAEVTHTHPPAVVHARDLEETDTGAMAVLVVALFLRSADEATAAELVAAAEGDWTALCASALQWLTTMVEKTG